MSKKITPERAISITWLSVIVTCCWPLSRSASKIQVICFKIVRTGCIISATLLLLPLLYATYLHYGDNSIIFIKSLCLATAACQIIVQTLFSISQYDRLQHLVGEMQKFCKNATTEERVVLQEYVDKYGTFYGFCMVWLYTSASIDSLATIFAKEQFPTDAEYPFCVDYWPIKPIIFCHQAFVCLQCAAHISVNIFGALIMFFTAARFEIVTRQMRKATDVLTLVACIAKYQQIRRYARETVHVVRIISLITIVISLCGLVLSGITLLSKQAFSIKVQFFFFTLIGLLETFMCALPADHLLHMSSDINQGAYQSAWYLQELHFQKQVLYAMSPQKPIAVSISCVMPILSLKYYCGFLSNAFSAFTALRVIFVEESD